ncbi:CotH kinase family protein [Hymenobacter sp. BT507]|uniref:CotH kinase family protein n=1 Tax=Hymenobacter citatus TaxID=2763506 RepID=A0ABR7MPE6_9BACT|nr:CotH kinase family protein [Hymenobacter citatus]MBC6612945.1 CotH kinase family protein [Hymenobacter citatus]
MSKVFTEKSSVILMLLLVLVTGKSFANEVIKVSDNFYHIDDKKRIIVVNQKINNENSGLNEYKSKILLDKTYELGEPTNYFDQTKSYIVKFDNVSYTLYFTELPIININTRNTIVDAPSVFADFSISETNGNVSNYAVGIEYRGGTSQSRPKKSYELSFLTDTLSAASRDVSFLGMRNDNKWNLQALYNEPLRTRSKVSNELWLDMHSLYYKDKEPEAKCGISMAYTEVFVNNEYKGVYALSERVDRKQLKLKKYSNSITGELYKGSYWDKPVVYSGLYDFNNSKLDWGGFEYKHPDEKTDWSNIYSFVDFVINSDDQKFNEEYAKKFNIDNAVDYFILLNLLRAGDNTGKNLYIAKYKVGEPYYYVPWDLDGVFGTDWTGGNSSYTEDILSNGFYDRLLKDRSATGFCSKLATRWRELRGSVITEEYIMAKFKRDNEYLKNSNAYEREMIAWDEYTYKDSGMLYIQVWLKNRLAYLDKTFGQYESVLSAKTSQNDLLKIYPNPASSYLLVDCGSQSYELCMQDINGRVVKAYTLTGRENTVDVSDMPKGMYIATLKNNKETIKKKVILR